jgi:predicted ATPase/DNA-binding NarL/FixJ family response regulator
MAKLPVPAPSFVGREHDVATATSQLDRPDVRLLVMTGPPGVGKTRLALATAAAIADRFPDGVAFVDLAPLNRSEQLLPTIAGELGLAEGEGQTPTERLVGYLRTRRTLLVLDNLETVVAAATDLEPVVAACPRVKLLVTSRVRLGVRGERIQPVEPLALPSANDRGAAETIRDAEAVRLFIERASAADPAFAATSESFPHILTICRHLEGIPLAIELAVARLPGRSLPELRAELDQRLAALTDGPEGMPDRLRTMRDAVAWSYDLLTPDLQALVRRLGVFRGGFTLDAAEAVADAPFVRTEETAPCRPSVVVPAPMFYRLGVLFDHNLIKPEVLGGSHRFVMLEVIREFALERLAVAGELELARKAHAEYFARHAEQTRAQVFTRRYKEAMGTIIVEQHNDRAAMTWARECDDIGLFLRLCTGLWEFWYQCGFIEEGRTWIEPVLEKEISSPAGRFGALQLAGFLAWLQGDDAQARRYHEAALRMGEAAGDQWAIAAARNFLALMAWRAGDAETMTRLATAALPVMRAAGDFVGEAIALVNLAIAAQLRRRFEEAFTLFGQARQICEEIGFLWTAAAADFGRGESALDLGHEAEAVESFRKSLAITADLGDRWGIGAAVGGLACVAARRGDVERAARLFAAADALLASGRTFLPTLDRKRYDKLRDTVERQCGPRAFARFSTAGRSWRIEEVIAEANRVAPDRAAPGRSDAPNRLSPKQHEVLKLLAEGKTEREIARAMASTQFAANAHIREIYRKLDVHSRAEAIARAYQRGLLP